MRAAGSRRLREAPLEKLCEVVVMAQASDRALTT
jgi:hypothetical protein